METVKVQVASARNLRSSLLHTPSAVVELHTIPGFPAVAASEAIPSTANPVWDFVYEYEVNNYPPHRVSFVVNDSKRPKAATLGRLSLEVIHPLMSGWFPLSEDEASSAEIFLTITCKNACEGRGSLSRLIKYEHPDFRVGDSSKMELRQVSDSPGFLFRAGELIVSIEAFGVPQSVGKPHVKVSLRDQFLKADETESSAAAWEKMQEEELAQQNEQIETGEADEAVNASHMDEQGKPGDESRVDGGGDYHTPAEHKEETEISESDESVANSRTWDGVMQSEPVISASNEARTGRTKILRVGSMSVGSMPLGEAPRKLLETGRKVALRKLRFSRTNSTKKDDTEVLPDVSRLSIDGEMETGVATRQNSEPEPFCKESLESGVLTSTSKDDLSRNPDAEAEQYKTKSVLSSLNPSLRTHSSTKLLPRKPTQSFAMFPFARSAKSRRVVDFGAVRLAVFAGEPPANLRIQLVDRISKLPGSMGLYNDQTIDLRGAQDLECSCGVGRTGHILYYQMNDSGPMNGKVVLRIFIRMRTWKPKAYTNNVTQHFLNILPRIDDTAQEFKEAFPEAEKLTYLLIGGLFTDHYPTYFEKNIQYLQESLCLPRVQSVPIHTEGSVERNTKIIRDSVMRTCRGAKSVVLIGHSKGGVDATAVIQGYPEIIPFLYGIITFQAPFGGTFLVDFVAQSRFAVSAIKRIIEGLWKGDQESVQDLCYSSRLKALGMVTTTTETSLQDVEAADVRAIRSGNPVVKTEHPLSTDIDIFKQMPIVSFGSFASFDLLGIRSAATAAGIASMSPAAKAVLDHTGFLCDGLVTSNDARIPFSDFVSLEDMMHTEPALYVHGTNYPPGKLTASALVLLFEMVRRRTGQNSSQQNLEVRDQ
ncbi:hypothetical protein FGB62_59g17 [Gracilaria domingensis]|nr:hypothetical protein FGB62_59g17 [Gracilaria domingensis]